MGVSSAFEAGACLCDGRALASSQWTSVESRVADTLVGGTVLAVGVGAAPWAANGRTHRGHAEQVRISHETELAQADAGISVTPGGRKPRVNWDALYLINS